MSVRKRTWTTRKGEAKEAWVVAYTAPDKDKPGSMKPHIRTFDRKRDADAYHAQVTMEVKEGRHTPDSQSITVAKAGEHWIRNGEMNRLERTTLDQYRHLLDRHIVPYLGPVKLSKLSTPTVTEFRTKLLEGTPAPGEAAGTKRSPYMVKRVISALSSILADAQQAGHVSQNVVRGATSRKKRGKAQQRRKLKVGVDIPTPAEVNAILKAAPARWRPFLMMAAMTGLRTSELRGLAWANVHLAKGELHVCQRADFYNDIGAPKSDAGDRTVPLPDVLVSVLREWKLACPKGPLGLVFPNTLGKVNERGHIIERGWWPAQVAAGVCTIAKDDDGKVVLDSKGEPVRKAKYLGLHCLRHFYASWCISREVDGGLQLPPKNVQERLGHSTIAMTMDTYGHLFKAGDDGSAMSKSAAALVG
jgi:integrase